MQVYINTHVAVATHQKSQQGLKPITTYRKMMYVRRNASENPAGIETLSVPPFTHTPLVATHQKTQQGLKLMVTL